jgi:hypothetical protein
MRGRWKFLGFNLRLRCCAQIDSIGTRSVLPDGSQLPLTVIDGVVYTDGKMDPLPNSDLESIGFDSGPARACACEGA